jgi:uncharacterized protein (TIGR00304 family)
MDRYRALRFAGGALVMLGIVLLVLAVLEGQASLALVLIVPVIYGTGPLLAISVLMIFAGLALAFLSFFQATPGTDTANAPRGKKEWGGVILIGPIPIVIGSAGMLKGRGAIVLLVMLSILVLLLFLFTFLR